MPQRRDAAIVGIHEYPLRVAPGVSSLQIKAVSAATALEDARVAGILLVVLVGDEPYYGKLGFRRIPFGQITLPGTADPNRLLAAELTPGALQDFSGVVAAERTSA